MKFHLNKIFFTAIMFFLSAFVTAEDAGSVPVSDPDVVSDSAAESASIGTWSAGASLQTGYAVGSYALYACTNFGVDSYVSFRPDFLPDLGFSLHYQAYLVLPQSETISFYSSMTLLLGASWDFDLSKNWTLVPELVYGPWLHILSAEAVDGRGLSSGLFVDQAIQLSSALVLKQGAFSMQISPVYTMLIESSGMVHLPGFRCGIGYDL